MRTRTHQTKWAKIVQILLRAAPLVLVGQVQEDVHLATNLEAVAVVERKAMSRWGVVPSQGLVIRPIARQPQNQAVENVVDGDWEEVHLIRNDNRNPALIPSSALVAVVQSKERRDLRSSVLKQPNWRMTIVAASKVLKMMGQLWAIHASSSLP